MILLITPLLINYKKKKIRKSFKIHLSHNPKKTKKEKKEKRKQEKRKKPNPQMRVLYQSRHLFPNNWGDSPFFSTIERGRKFIIFS